MKKLIFISLILSILLKTGNVLSNNNIFNVNNVEINAENSNNKEKFVNQAFKEGFEKLIKRLLLDEDYKKVSNLNLNQIKNFISYYQILNTDKKEETKTTQINIFFDKDRLHKFFYNTNILYSDIINTEVILFPLLKKDKQHFIYSGNYFYDNWNIQAKDNLIQYTLPAENIENIQLINENKENIFKLDVAYFFKEYENSNIVFAYIDEDETKADIFLKTIIEGKKINKRLTIEKNKNTETKFNKKIILEINSQIQNLIKSQNLIDVRTPSFLNVEIKLNKKNNLVEFGSRIKNIDLIDNYYVQQLTKDYVLVKIKYLGKIDKIINKLENQKIKLEMKNGQWLLNIT